MTRQEVIDAVISVIETLRKELVPYDTGNMALNALKYDIYEDMIDIYIDPEIAPYVPYTNEPWISPKWNGKKNPNEGWWDRFVAEFTKRLANKLKGVIK